MSLYVAMSLTDKRRSYDYSRRLSDGEHKALEVATEAIAKLTTETISHSFTTCPQMNVSVCTATAEAKGERPKGGGWRGLFLCRLAFVDLFVFVYPETD